MEFCYLLLAYEVLLLAIEQFYDYITVDIVICVICVLFFHGITVLIDHFCSTI